MTPEEEQAIREAGPGWCSEMLWGEIWQMIDAERRRRRGRGKITVD